MRIESVYQSYVIKAYAQSPRWLGWLAVFNAALAGCLRSSQSGKDEFNHKYL